jgi:hypothetical protein
MQDSMFKFARSRFEMMFVFCTLFIVREGEDMTKWVMEEQTAKIEDWNKECYNEQDFLALGLTRIQGYSKILKESAQNAVETEQV